MTTYVVTVRMSKELYELLKEASKVSKLSMNTLCIEGIQQRCDKVYEGKQAVQEEQAPEVVNA